MKSHAHRLAPIEAPSVAAAWAEQDLRSLDTDGLRRALEPLDSPQGPVIRIDGETLISFSSNDYLGLCNDPRLVGAAMKVARQRGLGMGSSRLLVGDSGAHRALEEHVARFLQAEAAVLFNNGYAANVGILSALCGPEDVIFSDELNHASIIDGCRVSRARTVVYPHGDWEALQGLLQAHSGRRRLVCTESVFSMEGDCAPLKELTKLCREHGAALLVDEAHALGVVGPGGRGLSPELGISDAVDVRMVTLGKAAGAFGAVAATSRPVADLLINRARSLVFSTALPPAVCAAALEGLRILERDDQLRAKLWRNIHQFADGLRQLGLPGLPRSPIFPVIIGSPEKAVEAARRLRAKGLLVKAIRPPTVPPGGSRLRFSITAAHTSEQIELALASLRELQETPS